MDRNIIIILVLNFSLGCLHVEGEEIDEVEQCIYNGTILNDKDFVDDYNRSVVGLSSSYNSYSLGTGILIAPRLVLTAGHCGTCECSDMSVPRDYVVRVGINSKYPIEEIPVIAELEHPHYGEGNPNIGKENCGGGWGIDLGFWVLERPPQYAFPYTKFGSVSEDDDLTLFGFGVALQNPEDKGYLRKGKGTVIKVNENNRIYISGNECIKTEGGDSGGAWFNEDGELVAIHSGSFRDSNVSIAQMVYTQMDWINSLINSSYLFY
jgi:hypothetical protein